MVFLIIRAPLNGVFNNPRTIKFALRAFRGEAGHPAHQQVPAPRLGLEPAPVRDEAQPVTVEAQRRGLAALARARARDRRSSHGLRPAVGPSNQWSFVIVFIRSKPMVTVRAPKPNDWFIVTQYSLLEFKNVVSVERDRRKAKSSSECSTFLSAVQRWNLWCSSPTQL